MKCILRNIIKYFLSNKSWKRNNHKVNCSVEREREHSGITIETVFSLQRITEAGTQR